MYRYGFHLFVSKLLTSTNSELLRSWRDVSSGRVSVMNAIPGQRSVWWHLLPSKSIYYKWSSLGGRSVVHSGERVTLTFNFQIALQSFFMLLITVLQSWITNDLCVTEPRQYCCGILAAIVSKRSCTIFATTGSG